MSKKITLVEVGPRDGLQNEKATLSEETRLKFVVDLAKAGLKRIEVGAFVSPTWVPQMAGSLSLVKKTLALQSKGQIGKDVELSALVPNVKGMEGALLSGVRHVAIFGAASESFSLKNINCSIDESFVRFEDVMKMAKRNKVKVRGYLSTCFGCPYEGKVPEKQVIRLTERMLDLGVTEISIGDTIGVATPKEVRSLVPKLIAVAGAKKIAMHFHDTRGTAVANILASLDLGIRVLDTSLGGLGGCPYAPGAAGNVSTEDVAYMLHGMGLQTGVDIPKLQEINRWMSAKSVMSCLRELADPVCHSRSHS